jgi:hypothetical protein
MAGSPQQFDLEDHGPLGLFRKGKSGKYGNYGLVACFITCHIAADFAALSSTAPR